MAGEVDVADAKARALEQWIQSAEKLMGDMLEDKQFFHAIQNQFVMSYKRIISGRTRNLKSPRPLLQYRRSDSGERAEMI
jgi:hypothetical protein